VRRFRLLIVALAAAIVLAGCGGNAGGNDFKVITESEVYSLVTNSPEKVKQLQFEGQAVTKAIASVPDESSRTELRQLAREKDIAFSSKSLPENGAGGGMSPFASQLVLMFISIGLIVGIIIFLQRRAQRAAGGGAGQMQFGKHKGKKFSPATGRVFFHEVTGQVEAKEELSEFVEFLKNPAKWLRFGATIPKGVLLVGPPGTGKTLLARAVAGEAGVPFYSISGSEFVEMFVGVGAARVRDLFAELHRNAPAILFIDELDGVGRQRGAGLGGSNDEREQTLNQILVEMDGFETDSKVVVIAATNRPDVLDPALLRPGRFSRQISVDRPDFAGRLATFQLYLKSKPVDPSIDVEFFARSTPGLSQADIREVCNDAAILRARHVTEAERNGGTVPDTIQKQDIDDAISRLAHGPNKESLLKVMTHAQKDNTAVHEVSHAVAYWVKSGGGALRKITIMPTTRALGYVQTLSDVDQFNMTDAQIISHIVMGLAGRVGQEKLLATTDTGAKGDNQSVWNWARAYVAEYGMSDLGIIYAPLGEDHPFLGKQISQGPTVSTRLADEIDLATMALIKKCRAEAETIIEQYRDAIREIADILIERETILGPEFAEIMEAATAGTTL
jgi:cell division protease FtsH